MLKTAAGTRPIHILLYTLIPAAREFGLLQRTVRETVRNRLRRALDLGMWRAFGVWRGHYSTFKDHQCTNRGDIAIRVGVKQQLAAAFAPRAVVFTDVAWGELSAALEQYATPDLVVIAGGGFLFADESGRLPVRFANDVAALARVSCPVAATSIGLNYLLKPGTPESFAFHPEAHATISQFLRRLNLGAVRDESTRHALSAFGVALPVIVDPAFLIARDAPVAQSSGVLNVGLNVAFHGGYTSHTASRMLPMVVRLAQRLGASQPCRFHYFVHSEAERAIARALQIAGVELEIVHADVASMIEAYRRIDIHVCQMLHSAIFATSVGTPVLNLAYDLKSAGFFKLLGLEAWCIDAGKVGDDDVLMIARALISKRHAVRDAILGRRAALAREAGQFYAAVADLADPEAAAPRRAGFPKLVVSR